MFSVRKTMEVAGSHSLSLDYDSPCANIHGHNWLITVHCRSETLDKNGMVVDFARVKKLVHDKLDHQHINNALGGLNPTAENIAKWVCDLVPCCYRVDVRESQGNVATYTTDGAR